MIGKPFARYPLPSFVSVLRFRLFKTTVNTNNNNQIYPKEASKEQNHPKTLEKLRKLRNKTYEDEALTDPIPNETVDNRRRNRY